MLPAAQTQTLREAAARDRSAEAAAQHLDAVSQLLQQSLRDLETQVQTATAGPAPLDQAALHLIGAGGKRVRPMACLLMTAAAGGDPSRVVPIAGAAELIHSATLLHDDVIDEGEERRNRPTARVLWGNLVSVLAGDLLLTRALSLVEQAGVPGAMADMLRTLERLVAGEVAQLHARGRLDLGAAGYFEIVGGKTASLFGFACRTGARAAQRPDLVEAAGCFGERIGVAYQIIDDVLDLSGQPALVGKQLGADLAEGKTTLPLALALERDSGVIAELLPRARAGDAAAAEQVSAHPEVQAACEAAREQAACFSREALAALDTMPVERPRELLRALALKLINRHS